MTMQFCLVLPDRDGEIIDTARTPTLLDFDRVLPYLHWQVAVKYENPHQFSVVAEVELIDAESYSPALAVAEVLEELDERFLLGEFNYRENWVDTRAIHVGSF
jgi:hypothetical protein